MPIDKHLQKLKITFWRYFHFAYETIKMVKWWVLNVYQVAVDILCWEIWLYSNCLIACYFDDLAILTWKILLKIFANFFFWTKLRIS